MKRQSYGVYLGCIYSIGIMFIQCPREPAYRVLRVSEYWVTKIIVIMGRTFCNVKFWSLCISITKSFKHIGTYIILSRRFVIHSIYTLKHSENKLSIQSLLYFFLGYCSNNRHVYVFPLELFSIHTYIKNNRSFS